MKHLTQSINYRLGLQGTEEKSEIYWRFFLFPHISRPVLGINITDIQVNYVGTHNYLTLTPKPTADI